jgi:hypothetical protein
MTFRAVSLMIDAQFGRLTLHPCSAVSMHQLGIVANPQPFAEWLNGDYVKLYQTSSRSPIAQDSDSADSKIAHLHNL